MQLGSFPEVRHVNQRRYLLAYWRYLLGWGRPPSRANIDPETGAALRTMAREEVLRYRASVDAAKTKLYNLENNYVA